MSVLLVQDLVKTQKSNPNLQQAAQTTSSTVMLVNAKKRGLPSNESTTEHTASSSPQIARLRIKNNQLANEVTKLKNELKKEQDTVKKQRATIVKQQTSLQQERNKNSPKNSSSKQSDISNKEFAKRNKELESELDTAKKANSRLSITKDKLESKNNELSLKNKHLDDLKHKLEERLLETEITVLDNKLSPGKPPQPEQSLWVDLPSLDEATQDQLIEPIKTIWTPPGGLSNVSLSDGDEYDARLDQGIILEKSSLTIREFIELLNKIKKTSFEDGRLI